MKMVQGGEINILRVKDLNKGFKGNIEVYLFGIRITVSTKFMWLDLRTHTSILYILSLF